MSFRFIICLFVCISSFSGAQERTYELKIQHISKNVTNQEVSHALAINGSIPAPTLRFNLGDIAIIRVVNETKEPTTMHWHGVLVPWNQDGPQFFNTRIIEPGKTHTFRFPIKHTGTYWYHSHTQFQEQRGLYGAIVIEEEKPRPKVNHDFVFMMSDWSNEHPKKIMSNIKKDGHYYNYKKNFLPSLWGALRDGEFIDYLKSEWTRMGPMDLSDIGYDAFLINGKIESHLKGIRPKDRVRFRIINASASTYFYFNIGNLRNFTVYTKDGMPVQPVQVNELLIGIAETYDVVFTVPENVKTFVAQATAQDISGQAVLTFGKGKREEVPQKPKPSAFKMDHGSHGSQHKNHGSNHKEHKKEKSHSHHQHYSRKINSQKIDSHKHPSKNMKGKQRKHHHKHSAKKKNHRLDYTMLKSVSPTDFKKNLIRSQVIELELSGDMDRYTWYINGKPFSEEKYIDIRENEVVTLKFINTTMMHHPMHLHGHFFRVLMGQNKWAPLFHTVDVAPMSTVTIEFHANEPGIWFLHCHNLYHMKMGMARLVKYEGMEQTPELKQDAKKWSSRLTHDNTGFWRGEVGIYTHKLKGGLNLNKGRYQLDSEFEFENYEEFEGEGFFKRYLTRFFTIGAGAVYDQNPYGAVYLSYVLPGLIEWENYLRHDRVFVSRLEKEIHLTGRVGVLLASEFEYEEDWKVSYELDLHYNFNPHLSFGVHYEKEEEEVYGFGFDLNF